MRSKEEVLSLLSQNKPSLEKRFKVKRIGLFGSYARGEQTENSDVDILVEVDPSIGLEFITLADSIEHLLGTKVDLVSHRALKPRAKQYIERELIYV